jgi:hypothetical protein
MINWDPATQSITGTTTISAQATQRLNSFYVDLALHTDKVTVNGVACCSQLPEASPTSTSNPRKPIAIGCTFQMVVNYSGKPARSNRATYNHGWPLTASGSSRRARKLGMVVPRQ